MPHITGDLQKDHMEDPDNPGQFQTLSEGEWGPASDAHAIALRIAAKRTGTGGVTGGITFVTGGRFQAKTAADGSVFAFDTSTGVNSGPLSPVAPTDPARPDISFHTDTVTGTFFAVHRNSPTEEFPGGLWVEVISERTPEIQRGFQHVTEAITGVHDAGLNSLAYDYVYSDGRVFPVLREQIPPTQDSFFTSTDASGQLLIVSRLTGASTPIGATPRASDVPPDATVELDPVTGQFKVTQPNGQISFLQAPVDFKKPTEVEIGGQIFAFNPNTGGFQQVQQPDRQFDPGVVDVEGRQFIQGPDGRLTPLGREEVPNLDELINARILSGDADGALALADFRDRPTSLEAFNAAMQFAQSPGDVAAISAISRGQSLVQPPPTGDVQRIAQQPEFLQDAFQRLMGQFRGEGPEGFEDVLARINREEREERGDTGITGIDSLLDFRTGRVGDPNEATRQGNIAINEAFQLVADSLFKDFPEGRARNRQINNFRSQMVREQAAGVGPITVESIISRGRTKLKEKQKAAAERQALEAVTDSGDPFRGGETFTPEEAALFVPDGAFDREVFDALIAERQEFARTNNNEDDDSDDDSEVESPSEPDSPSESPSEESAS